jgi:hypothetical protein
MKAEHIELGYFGNIWVRQNNFPHIGDSHAGHQHKFDHVTLLARGSVRVEVDGYEPKEYTAPTFMIMRKDKNHKMTATSPDTIYYCVFALRDIDGEVVDPVYGPKNDPMAHSSETVNDGHWDKIKDI